MRKVLLSLLCLSTAVVVSAQQLGTEEYKGYKKYIAAVDEYVPAPGQFINTMPKYEDGDDAAVMVAKCTAALANNKGGMVCLGAYGGYVTFHFDHSIANVEGQKDFYIKGNAMANGAEPGIVMVSKDLNGDGLPNDPWYELSGSADVDDAANVVYNYEITYTKDAMQNVPWTDNKGNRGVVERNSFHTQEYFPLWLESPLTFKGTLLPKNAVQSSSTGYWELSSFRYGYVDNLPNSDIEGNSFDIAWAVDADRNPVVLDAIDFVRVYSAENQMAGWLGETSTEVAGAEDLHLEASIDAQEAAATVATFEDIFVPAEGHIIFKPENPENNKPYNGSFERGLFKFNASYTNFDGYDSWGGFAIANHNDNTYVGLDDQYKNAKGGGHNSANYAVAYVYGNCSVDVEAGSEGAVVSGFYLNNAAYALNSVLNGDPYSGAAFATGDWFKLTITGTKADGTKTSKDVYLADYRSANDADHYYISDWTWVDLSTMGALTNVSFALSSTRTGDWGMNTPAYFCIDDFGGCYDGSAPTAIVTPSVSVKTVPAARFAIDGKRLSAPQRGLNIIRMSDGTVRKVMVK